MTVSVHNMLDIAFIKMDSVIHLNAVPFRPVILVDNCLTNVYGIQRLINVSWLVRGTMKQIAHTSLITLNYAIMIKLHNNA